ncbi:methylamine utilization protein MauE [Pedobacter cryoconitis]|uniref:Methylamine utilization protein MauE n=2 Tax=Pedobacter cryoconitis TaxID=188932 RepID=A0A327SJ56_9SPHI|nr:methylamine utilization protein MauE [Pedobacter cryoconitis]
MMIKIIKMELINLKKSIRLAKRVKESIAFIITLICIFLFLTAGYSKFTDHERFEFGLANIALIGSSARTISWIVPIIEIAISLLLIVPKTNIKGLYAFTGTMIVFTIYILSMFLWAKELPCQCNLIIKNLSWAGHIWFNLIIIGLSVLAIKINKTNVKS